MSQRSAGACTRCTRSKAFPELEAEYPFRLVLYDINIKFTQAEFTKLYSLSADRYK